MFHIIDIQYHVKKVKSIPRMCSLTNMKSFSSRKFYILKIFIHVKIIYVYTYHIYFLTDLTQT